MVASPKIRYSVSDEILKVALTFRSSTAKEIFLVSDGVGQLWYDVIVVGMGPAGASTAYELCHAGLSVLGLEKHTHPRYKVCGGALSARIDHILPPEYKQVVEEVVHRLQFSYGPKESFFCRVQGAVCFYGHAIAV